MDLLILHYGNIGRGVFKGGIQNLKGFLLKVKITKGNYWILRIGVMGRCQKVPKFDFQCQKSLKNTNLGAHFLITSIFKSLYFLKWCPIYDSSPLQQFSKFKYFLWICWFLGLPCLKTWIPVFEIIFQVKWIMTLFLSSDRTSMFRVKDKLIDETALSSLESKLFLTFEVFIYNSHYGNRVPAIFIS